MNSNLWPLLDNAPLFTSSTAKEIAPDIVNPGLEYSRLPEIKCQFPVTGKLFYVKCESWFESSNHI